VRRIFRVDLDSVVDAAQSNTHFRQIGSDDLLPFLVSNINCGTNVHFWVDAILTSVQIMVDLSWVVLHGNRACGGGVLFVLARRGIAKLVQGWMRRAVQPFQGVCVWWGGYV